MSDIEAVNLRTKRRAEEAGLRADELRRRYEELTQQSGSSPAQVQHARRAAIAARSNALESFQSLLEQLDRSAAIHLVVARAHDEAAAAARGHPDMVGHAEAAARHRAAAGHNRSMAARLRERAAAEDLTR